MTDDQPPLPVSEQLRAYIRQGQDSGIVPNTYRLALELGTDGPELHRWLKASHGPGGPRFDMLCAYLDLVLVPADYLRQLEFQVGALKDELCQRKNP